uniref:Uncharacterized protein n=1 Tax=Neogobius melanostomus TaxID=47308 RepID=A0A8C6TI02_9GOBI
MQPNIEIAAQEDSTLAESLQKRAKHSNITPGEHRALLWLAKNEDIVIKPADKGGATVVWGKQQYITEAHRQLSDTNYYSPVKSNPLPNSTSELKILLDEAHDNRWLTDKERDFLMPLHPRTAVFYLLPKIHKDLHTPPGRPIISGIGTITEPASKYIDFLIKPLTTSLRSYLHDSTDNDMFSILTTHTKTASYGMGDTLTTCFSYLMDRNNNLKIFISSSTTLIPT